MRWILSRLEWSLPINHLSGVNKANDLFILSVVDTVTRRPGLGRIVRDLACLSGLKNRSGIYTTISVRKFEKNVRVKKGKFSINFNWHPGVFFLKSGVSEAGDLATLFIDHPHPDRKKNSKRLYRIKTFEKLFKSVLDYHSGYHQFLDSLYKLILYKLICTQFLFTLKTGPMHQEEGKFHRLS